MSMATSQSSLSPFPRPSSKPKPRNKHDLYRNPLPLRTHPLPAFIPHNPLSLLRIAWALLAELVYPPTSHCNSATKQKAFQQVEDIHTAYLSSHTNTAHVTTSVAIRALWEGGFFGKGSLSRSEPEWMDRLLARLKEKEARARGERTAAEVTAERRRERRNMKRKRAKEEVEQVERLLREEKEKISENSKDSSESTGTTTESPSHDMNGHILNKDGEQHQKTTTKEILGKADLLSTQQSYGEGAGAVLQDEDLEVLDPPITRPPSNSELFTDQEHLQLSPQETLFLVYGLGILRVVDTIAQVQLTVPALLKHFCATSSFPPEEKQSWTAYSTETLAALEPDNPFLLHYAAYHYFRSLGWVARPGVKFSVDLLLYARGPVFSHAQFAVVIIPAYRDPYWDFTPERRRRKERAEKRDWWWFHAVNRVQSAVMKTLVLCYVEVPRPMEVEEMDGDDVGAMLRRYRVRCVTCRRWAPQRNLK